MSKISEFDRIFSPRAVKAVKAISLLTNGTKYAPTQEEKNQTLLVLKDAVNDIAQLYGMLPGGQVVVKDVVPSGEEEETSESRVADKMAFIKRSPFARGDVDANVRSIPENQLTAYATHIMARLCSKFEEPEAKPKNFVKAD